MNDAHVHDLPAASIRGAIAGMSIFAEVRIVAGMSHRSELPPEHLVAEFVGLLDDGGEIDDPADAAPVLPIIARALTGAGDAIAWPETLDPWEEDDEELSIFDGELHPAARRAPGDTTGRRRAKRKAQRSARKHSRRR